MSAMSTFVATRPIGDISVSVISEGSMRFALALQAPEADWRRAMPEADAEGAVTLGINSAVIQSGEAVIVVDPGFPDPEAAERSPFKVTRSPGLAAGMALLGLRPEAVTHVVITHGHWDHYAGVDLERTGRRVPRFPNARHLLGLAEWGGGSAGAPAALAARLAPVEAAGLLDLVSAEQVVAPGVAILPAPGESAGHQIVRVSAAGATAYYLGDLFHHACEVAYPEWTSPGREVAAMLASRRRFLRQAADEDAIALFTHAPFPGWGRIVRDDGTYRWQPVA